MYSVKERGILIYSYHAKALFKTFTGFLNVDYENITPDNAKDLINDHVENQIIEYAKSEDLIFFYKGNDVSVEIYNSAIQRKVGRIVLETTLPMKNALEEFIESHTDDVNVAENGGTFKLIRGHLYEPAHEAVIQMKLAQKQLGLGKDVVGLICRYIWSTRQDEEWIDLIPKTKRAKLNL